MFGTYRTLLALVVVASHLGGVPGIGGYAVFGFYTLSGYLMTLIMQSNYGYSLGGISRYAANRFLRIYPIYWVSIIFSAILVFIVGEKMASEYHRAIYFPQNLTQTIKNIFIFFSAGDEPRLTPPAWALTVEIFYYILIGLGLSKTKLIVLSWVAISIIYHAVAVYLGLGSEHRYFSIPAASLPFATGAFIYHYRNEISMWMSRARGQFGKHLPFLMFVIMLSNGFGGYITRNSDGLFFYSNYILCALMVAVLSEKNSLPYVTKKFDKWIGDFSYPIYLIHLQVGLIVVVLMGAAGFTYKRPDIIVMLVSIPFILLLSWVFNVAIESPIELIRAKVKKSNNRACCNTTKSH